MITLDKAIQLANEAHKNQWRNTSVIQTTQSIEDLKSTYSGCKIEETFLVNTYNLGKPYISHPLAVMQMMDTEEEKIIAVLHDVFENCKNYALSRAMDNSKFYIKNRETLDEYIITANIYQALTLLSKEKHTDYITYILNIVNGQLIPGLIDRRPNKLAIKVKIADMMHNISETTNLIQKDKYLQSLPILLKGL